MSKRCTSFKDERFLFRYTLICWKLSIRVKKGAPIMHQGSMMERYLGVRHASMPDFTVTQQQIYVNVVPTENTPTVVDSIAIHVL